MLVVDANVVVWACGSEVGFDHYAREELVAPPFMWAEARNALHEALWRGEASRALAEAAHARLESAPVRSRAHVRLGPQAWQLAEEFGWAKTYDAEYVALAQLLDCRLVTLNARLRRACDRLGFVVGPTEL
ncbi:MAG: type II toxin-antitoxin system VapC family toxin [Actinobacteria bacterium]|nr:type II toxin-antitoxin system VapC family toxin [Actinomycetota bacterium]